MKNNPLFVDSTKFHGDLISTNIELRKVILYDEELLFVVVKNHQGVTRKLPMKLNEDFNFEARIHLNHQTPVTYQFVVEKDEHRVYSSPIRDSRAQYALIEEWRPVLENPDDLPVTDEPAAVSQKTVGTTPKNNDAWARESVMNVKQLMDKWGL